MLQKLTCLPRNRIACWLLVSYSVIKQYIKNYYNIMSCIIILVTHIQNYRPISVLPFFSKIFEKVIYNKLIEFISANNIFYEKQFGSAKGMQQVMLL